MLDLTYINLSADGDAGPIDVDVDGSITLGQTQVSKKLTDDGTLRGDVGFRYWDIDVKIGVSPGPSPSGSESWVDPIIGLRKDFALSDDGLWTLVTAADVGGFNIGHSSDITYQGAAVARREFEGGNLLLGYRYLFAKYDTGSGANKFEFNAKLFGPVVGWVFRF